MTYNSNSTSSEDIILQDLQKDIEKIELTDEEEKYLPKKRRA
jgi:hypothetical protein